MHSYLRQYSTSFRWHEHFETFRNSERCSITLGQPKVNIVQLLLISYLSTTLTKTANVVIPIVDRGFGIMPHNTPGIFN